MKIQTSHNHLFVSVSKCRTERSSITREIVLETASIREKHRPGLSSVLGVLSFSRQRLKIVLVFEILMQPKEEASSMVGLLS